MGRIARLICAVLLFGVGFAEAGTGLRLDIGIGGEYWQESSGSQSLTAEQEAIRAAIDMVLSGHVVDSRFLAFRLGVHGSLFRLDPEGGDVGTNRPIGYDGRIRAFSNRLFSFDVMASRITTETTGESIGAVAGTRTSSGATVRFRPKDFPSLMVRHHESTFEADDPTTYLDEEQTLNSLESRWGRGRFNVSLDSRMEERSFSGGRILNTFNYGALTLDYNRSGDNSFFSLLQAASSETTVDGLGNSPTQSLISRSIYTRKISDSGRLSVSLDHQGSGFGSAKSTNDQAAVALFRSLSREFSLEAVASYLVGKDSAGQSIRQPAIALGIPWSHSNGKLQYVVRPRLTYTGRPVETDEADSKFGGSIYGSIRWYRGRSSLVLEGESLYNNLSIVPLGPGTGGGSLLGGLVKSHAFARVTVAHAFAPDLNIEGAGEYRTTTRIFQGFEADESQSFVRFGLNWQSLSFKTFASAFDVTGGDLPRTRESIENNLVWRPKWWLRCYLRHRDEETSDPVVESSLRLNEAGVELKYGKLIYYMRWRRDSRIFDGAESYEYEKFWVGFRRLFNLQFGGRPQW